MTMELSYKHLTDDELGQLAAAADQLASVCGVIASNTMNGPVWGDVARNIAALKWNAEGEQNCREHDRALQPQQMKLY